MDTEFICLLPFEQKWRQSICVLIREARWIIAKGWGRSNLTASLSQRYKARSLAESGEERKECWKFEKREDMNNDLGSWENMFLREELSNRTEFCFQVLWLYIWNQSYLACGSGIFFVATLSCSWWKHRLSTQLGLTRIFGVLPRKEQEGYGCLPRGIYSVGSCHLGWLGEKWQKVKRN